MPFKSPHPLYQTWQNMRQRCRNHRNPLYRFYGAKGVTVCARWDSFDAFVADMGPKPTAKHSIDRIDTFGNYEPGNCRWSVKVVQNRNQRRTRYVTIEDVEYKASVLSAITGLKTDTIVARAAKGLSLEKALGKESTRDPEEHRQSMRRAILASAGKKRAATHCKKGHEFTAENTEITRGGAGRRCKTCSRLRDERYRKLRHSIASC